MPLYEYICDQCHARFEALRSMNQANAPIACEQCGSFHTHRQPSVFSAISNGKVIAGQPGCSSCSGGHCSNCGGNGH